MKARVIREWEMYGTTHKAGEIMTISLHSSGGLPMISDRDSFLLDNGFIEEIKEPLIKDEKIRKAILAWADANDLLAFKVVNEHFECFKIIGYGDHNISSRIEFKSTIANANKNQFYTIDELCGDEEK